MKLFFLTQRRKVAKEIFFASSHLCVIYFLLFTTSYAQKIDVPKLERYVTDQTNTLLSSETQRLEQALISFEEQTSNQITVLIIPTLGEESLEDYSIRVAEKNLIGQKKSDNGILFLIVKDDRKIRIEVGYGLEGVLTDALTSEIIRNIIAPNFRDGNYSIGIFYAVDAIMQATKGEYIGAGKKHRSRKGGNDSVLIYIIAIIAFFLFNGIFRKRRGFIGSSRGWNSSGMFLGGFGGGSGFGGFGGFSGGGGSFGGGGASGSW